MLVRGVTCATSAYRRIFPAFQAKRGTHPMQAGSQPPLLAPLTQEDLGQLQVHLPALKIISYRGPGHTGGVVSSLSPLTKQLGTQVNWIALSGVPASDSAQVAGFTFYRADVTA